MKTRRRRRQLELAAARAAAGAQVDDADKTLLRGQVLALQQQVALLTCPAASDAAPPPAVSPPEVRGRNKEGGERARARESERARERERVIGDVEEGACSAERVFTESGKL